MHQLIHLRTQHLGPEELLVGAKVELDPGARHRRVAAAIDDVEAPSGPRCPIARVIYLEPDVYDPARDDGRTGHPVSKRTRRRSRLDGRWWRAARGGGAMDVSGSKRSPAALGIPSHAPMSDGPPPYPHLPSVTVTGRRTPRPTPLHKMAKASSPG